MRKALIRVGLLLALVSVMGPAAARAQPAGSVLTITDIQSEHLIERPVSLEGREWLGLVADGQSWRLQRMQPTWRGSELFGDSVFALVVGPETPHLLLADVPGVRAGPAETIIEIEVGMYADARAFEIGMRDRVYELELHGSDPMLCDATVTLTDGTLTQTLYTPESEIFSCDEPHFSVQWAGDLDGDGRLDFVTTFSPKYSWYPRHLYLSSAAGPGQLVGLVAVLEAAAA